MPEEDQKPPQRLQGLSSRGRGGLRGGLGGRFMPNAVGRRSKEERESTAPAMKPSDPTPDERAQRPKFERRAKKQMGTRAEAAGPLAAPSIAAPSRQTTSSGSPSVSSGSRTRASVQIKRDPEMAEKLANPDQRIDMSSVDRDGEESYFPVRMPRDPVEDSQTKSEQVSDALPGQIVDSNNSQFALDPQHLYLVQLPELGLRPGKTPPHDSFLAGLSDKQKDLDVKEEPEPEPAEDVSMVDADQELKETKQSDGPGPAGHLGTMRTHASGKITLLIGGCEYEVMAGSNSRSAEELVCVDEASEQAFELGPIGQRLLVVPNIDGLSIQ